MSRCCHEGLPAAPTVAHTTVCARGHRAGEVARPARGHGARTKDYASANGGISPTVFVMSMTEKFAPCGSVSAAKRPKGLSIGPN